MKRPVLGRFFVWVNLEFTLNYAKILFFLGIFYEVWESNPTKRSENEYQETCYGSLPHGGLLLHGV